LALGPLVARHGSRVTRLQLDVTNAAQIAAAAATAADVDLLVNNAGIVGSFGGEFTDPKWIEGGRQGMEVNFLGTFAVTLGRHHDSRRVIQTNMAEMGVAPHVADMILNHAIKGAPKSRAHYDVHHYIPEKRDALAKWVRRLTKILGHNPNRVMDAERKGFQGKGPARRLGKLEGDQERKARLAAAGRDINAERRQAPRSGNRQRHVKAA
jgi:hypothetical protein